MVHIGISILFTVLFVFVIISGIMTTLKVYTKEINMIPAKYYQDIRKQDRILGPVQIAVGLVGLITSLYLSFGNKEGGGDDFGSNFGFKFY